MPIHKSPILGWTPDKTVVAANNMTDLRISPREIAFDVDGVFADTFGIFLDIANNRYGYSFSYQDITEYEFMNVIDIDERTSQEIINALLDNPIGNGIKSISGAVEVLTRLSAYGRLLFVTARPEKGGIDEWIYRQLPGVRRDLIHVEATNSHKNKLPILLEHRIRYFVEDRLETCYLLEKEAIRPIVFEQPWNRKPHPFPVVRSWEEISDIIEWS